MKLSTERTLTTHAGSMPRGEPLSSMLIDQEDGKRIDRRKIEEVTDDRVASHHKEGGRSRRRHSQ